MPVMITSKDCSEQIPAEPLTQTIRFSQVISLNATTEDGKTAPLTLSGQGDDKPGRKSAHDRVAVPAWRLHRSQERQGDGPILLSEWLARSDQSGDRKAQRFEVLVGYKEFITDPVITTATSTT